MTTVSFQISNPQETERLLAVLRAFEVVNLKTEEDVVQESLVSDECCAELEKSLPEEHCIFLDKSIQKARAREGIISVNERKAMTEERYNF